MWHSQQPTLPMTNEACSLSPSGLFFFSPSWGGVQAVSSIPFCQKSCCERFPIRSADELRKAKGDVEWSETRGKENAH